VYLVTPSGGFTPDLHGCDDDGSLSQHQNNCLSGFDPGGYLIVFFTSDVAAKITIAAKINMPTTMCAPLYCILIVDLIIFLGIHKMSATSECTSPLPPGTLCITVTNYTSESLQLQTGGKKIKSATEIASQKKQQYTVQTNKASLINVVGVTSKTQYATLSAQVSSVIVYPKQSERAPLTKSKETVLIASGIIGFVATIICGIFIHKIKQRAQTAFCEQQNLQGEECDEEIALNFQTPDGYSSGALVFGAVLGGILFVVCLVLWFFAFGPLRYASLHDCKGRDGWGVYWFWVKPRSKFRQFLCSVFGACECASDVLSNMCDVLNRNESGSYSWNEKKIAKMHTTSNCQCCSDRGCVNPLKASEECTGK